MGGPVIETIAPGIQFVPEAARAFRRANAQVRAEFGRDIDVNSTYRDWNQQFNMWQAWNVYVASGYNRSLYPGHSKALHPNDPLAFHTKGLALDSDDWRNQRIVQILAEHGFIRNRLHVPNEEHHFEYLRDRDQHRNDPAPATTTTLPEEDDMLFLNVRTKKGPHKISVGPGILRHFIGTDPIDKIMRLSRSADDWQDVEWSELDPLLWTYGIDLNAYRMVGNGARFEVLVPLEGRYREGGMWSAVNALRAGKK